MKEKFKTDLFFSEYPFNNRLNYTCYNPVIQCSLVDLGSLICEAFVKIISSLSLFFHFNRGMFLIVVGYV